MTPICLRCRRLRRENLPDGTPACDAFPEGIPAEIFDGKADHTRPFKGDRGLRFVYGEPGEPA
jgi:hypothetical protein